MLLYKGVNNYYIYDYFIFKKIQVSKKMKKNNKNISYIILWMHFNNLYSLDSIQINSHVFTTY
jgi:hypothetical protein